MKQMKGLHKAMSLLTCAALVGGAAYSRADDTLEQNFGGTDNQNELPGPTRHITVEMHEGTNMAAVPSPDGRQMVLSLQGGLWIIPASGGTATKITPWDVESTQPVWSPDGEWIAFQNYSTAANFAIWVVKPDGSQLHALTSGPFDDREPSWYPDSSKLIFSSDRSNDKQYKIWSVTLDGALQRLTTGTGAESNPVVSPDGTKIAFVNTGNTIYTMPANLSAAPTQFGSGSYPQWTPNSQNLAYQNTAGNLVVNGNAVTSGEDMFPFPVHFMGANEFVYTASGKIRTRDANGGNLEDIAFSATQVLRRPVITPRPTRASLGATTPQPVKGVNGAVISPDGQSVAFIALNDLWMMKSGEAPERLTNDADRAVDPRWTAPVRLTNDTDRDVDPRWTADSRFIYWSTDKNNAGNLAVDKIDVVTRQRTRVAAIQGVSMIQPTLSPTEDRFAYSTASGLTEVMDIATGTRTQLVEHLSPQPQVGRPSWSPDGTKIMVTDNDRVNPRFREGYNKLRVIDIATKTATWYAVGPAPAAISDRTEGAAVWSPDGTKVAFTSDSVLKVMPTNADGSPSGPAVQITNEVSDMPSWQADSQTLLYMSAGKLKKIKVDGTGQQNVPLRMTYTPAAPTGTTIIHAGQLWWGGSPVMKSNVDIIIKGNRIASIEPHQSNRPQTPGTTFVDASQQTVLPGLWDPHFHPLNVYQGSQFNQVWAAMFAYGFTSVQSVAGPVYASTEIREALDAGNLIGPRLFTSTPLLEGNRMSYDMSRAVRNAQVADLEVTRFAAVDIDWIKTYVRDPIPAMNRFAAAAQRMGIPSGTHLLYPGYSTGIQGLTHLQATQRMGYGWAKSPTGVAYQDVNALVGPGEMHLTETLGANRLAAQSPILLGGDRFNVLMPIPYVSNLLSMTPPTPAQIAAIKVATDDDARAIAAGALFAIGTDVPLNPPGVTNHSNLMALGLSMSNYQALQAITINAAKIAYKDKDLGTVEVGKLADLTIVDGDPLQDLKYAAAVHYVVKNGVVYTLDQIIAPFKSPAQLAARRKALVAFDKRCKEDSRNCFVEAHSAGD
ncbi:MAG TPA: amidohydrolase family protein [Steroidobacteraceae bacterium]|nr:amidohydrolase family protein [Steroidobacteraceae bacterium]